MLDQSFFTNLAVMASILMLAALGGLFSERSGVINIALEGKMLAGACFSALVSANTGNPLFGILAGVLAAIMLSLVHYALTQLYDLEHILAGMAINLLAFGVTNFVAKKFMETGPRATFYPVMIFVGMAMIATALSWFALYRTRAGLRILAVGNHPGKSRQSGINPLDVRFRSLIVTGVLSGLSGCLIVSNSGNFTDMMTAGRGFIALAALILGGWRPVQTAIACIGFAAFEAIQIQLQGRPVFGVELPAAIWSMMPYLITLITLMGFVGKTKAPSGLGQP